MQISIGILTVSDRASAGVYEDKSGAAIRDVLTRWVASEWKAEYRVIPDEQPLIEATLREMSDALHCSLIVT
ncbi:MAG: molybdopterin adenylyltransferase, partial [Gemmatimonadaceae bacterium]